MRMNLISTFINKFLNWSSQRDKERYTGRILIPHPKSRLANWHGDKVGIANFGPPDYLRAYHEGRKVKMYVQQPNLTGNETDYYGVIYYHKKKKKSR